MYSAACVMASSTITILFSCIPEYNFGQVIIINLDTRMAFLEAPGVSITHAAVDGHTYGYLLLVGLKPAMVVDVEVVGVSHH